MLVLAHPGLPLSCLDGAIHLQASLGQAWPPFVLVAALIALGQLAGADGLFDAAASRLVRLSGTTTTSLLACLGVVLLVTAVLNLDTSAVFLTPVLIGVARRRRAPVEPFLYGGVFMANASSLFLPGSNLTNLLVLSAHRPTGGSFLAQMLPAALAAPIVTAVGLVLIHRRALRDGGAGEEDRLVPVRVGAGLIGALLAAVAMLLFANPALPVLGVALVLVAWRARRGGPSPAATLRALGLPVLAGLFCLSVALGVFARSGVLHVDRLQHAGSLAVAATAAGAGVLINNLPAAVLLSAGGHLPVKALLIGLNVGPNLAVTGSLAVLLWWRAARAAGERPSALSYSRQGLLLAPAALLVCLLAISL